jgi:hypothetical protein
MRWVALCARHPPHQRVDHRVIALDEQIEGGALALLRPAQGQIIELGAPRRRSK